MSIAGAVRPIMVQGMRMLGRGARPAVREGAKKVGAAAQAVKGPVAGTVKNPVAQAVMGGMTGGLPGAVAQPVVTALAGKFLPKGAAQALGGIAPLAAGAVAAPLSRAATNAVGGLVGGAVDTVGDIKLQGGETILGQTPGAPAEVIENAAKGSRAQQDVYLDGLVDPRYRAAQQDVLRRAMISNQQLAMLKGDLQRDKILGDNIQQAIASQGQMYGQLLTGSNPYVGNF